MRFTPAFSKVAVMNMQPSPSWCALRQIVDAPCASARCACRQPCHGARKASSAALTLPAAPRAGGVSQGNRRRSEVLGDTAPELGHVDHLRRLEFASPQSEVGQRSLMSLSSSSCAMSLARPDSPRRRRAARPVGHRRGHRRDVGVAEGFRVIGPTGQDIAEPDLLPALDERFWQIPDALEQEEPTCLRNPRVHHPKEQARRNVIQRAKRATASG